MSSIIEKYYNDNNVAPALVKQKLERLGRNPDIEKEFEYWIENKQYKPDSLEIEGYTAQKLSQLSKYLIGEGAFMLLIELREAPDKAHKKIARGFKVK
jgi:hypothetical protein